MKVHTGAKDTLSFSLQSHTNQRTWNSHHCCTVYLQWEAYLKIVKGNAGYMFFQRPVTHVGLPPTDREPGSGFVLPAGVRQNNLEITLPQTLKSFDCKTVHRCTSERWLWNVCTVLCEVQWRLWCSLDGFC